MVDEKQPELNNKKVLHDILESNLRQEQILTELRGDVQKGTTTAEEAMRKIDKTHDERG